MTTFDRLKAIAARHRAGEHHASDDLVMREAFADVVDLVAAFTAHTKAGEDFHVAYRSLQRRDFNKEPTPAACQAGWLRMQNAITAANEIQYSSAEVIKMLCEKLGVSGG